MNTVSSTDYIASNDHMTVKNESENISKKSHRTILEFAWENVWKIPATSDGFLPKIRTQYLSNTGIERYRYAIIPSLISHWKPLSQWTFFQKLVSVYHSTRHQILEQLTFKAICSVNSFIYDFKRHVTIPEAKDQNNTVWVALRGMTFSDKDRLLALVWWTKLPYTFPGA